MEQIPIRGETFVVAVTGELATNTAPELRGSCSAKA